MSLPAPVDEAELHAFIDGELDPARHEEIGRILRDVPELAARVAAYTADRDQLRAALGGMTVKPVPDAWARRIDAATAARSYPVRGIRPVLSRRFAIAAGLALMIGGPALVALGWPQRDTILAAAQAAREGEGPTGDNLPGVLLDNPERRNGVIRSTLGMPVRVPDLQRFGFRLARLTTFSRAAELRYGDGQGRLLTIYVRPSNGEVRFDLLKRGRTRICVWQDDVVGAVIMAPLSAGEMLRVASAAYSDLNL